jgi:TolB-like protein/tetratricopeptide (TPR) repeat protein
MPGRRHVFGPFVLDAEAGTLLRDGAPVPVGYRALLLLTALLDRQGEIVSKSDLIDAAWQGASVEETNLSVQIAALRKLLGPPPDGGEWIATVARVGYRFVGAVARPGSEAGGGEPSLREAAGGPSIAVLPFVNLSDDREQEYFADGIVEEIITALSRLRWLFVIARNSSFTYKGRAVDVKQVGRELGVRYALEGSVRKAGSRVRITGQLVDTATGAHLWADRFEGELADIFDLQDQVTANVAGAIAPKLEEAEIERAKRKPTGSLDAYDCYLRGMAAFHKYTREGNAKALAMFAKAIALDPGFAVAYSSAARCYAQRKSSGWSVDRIFEAAETGRLARRAAELGRDDPVALFGAGISLALVLGELDEGDGLIERALALNPNLAQAWFVSGWVKVWRGEPEVAIEREARAMRLSPNDLFTFNMQSAMAAACFFAGRDADALSWADRAMLVRPQFIPPYLVAAASAARLGNGAAAARAMARLRELAPDLRLSGLSDLLPIRNPDHVARWTEGLRKAGLPE